MSMNSENEKRASAENKNVNQENKNTIKNSIRNVYQKAYKRLRAFRLKNKDFTIISNNCCGGIMYHDLKHRFLSPTINLYIPADDYLLFVENLFDVLNLRIIEEKDTEYDYPVGVITLPDHQTIHIYFIHYKSFEEAANKWYERSKRIHKDNLFIFMEMGKSTSDERVERFLRLPFRHKLAVTNTRYSDRRIQYSDIYDESYFSGKILEHKHGISACKRYLDDIDYISWLNEE